MQNLAKAKAVSEDAEKKRREKERKEAAETLNSNLTAAAGNAKRAPQKPVVGKVGVDAKRRIAQHVESCREVPPGIENLHTHKVDIIVTLDKDGNVLTADVQKDIFAKSDRTIRIAEAEAVRAVIACSPLPVPPLSKYQEWKTIVFPFGYDFLKQ